MSYKSLPEFVEFPKISRLSRECVITEKLDGTNASITITEDGQFLTGSRTRWITPEDDNYGFSKWAHEHKEELLGLGVGTHFGEWWGGGIQRNYGLPKDDKRFWLFNTIRWCRHGETPRRICNRFCALLPSILEHKEDGKQSIQKRVDAPNVGCSAGVEESKNYQSTEFWTPPYSSTELDDFKLSTNYIAACHVFLGLAIDLIPLIIASVWISAVLTWCYLSLASK